MGSIGGANIVKENLVLALDAANSKSFRGEPTINLSYNNGQTGSEYLANRIDWVNAGAWTPNDNETDIQKPITTSLNLRILSGIVTTVGEIQFGCSSTNILPSTTYTISVYFRQNRAGISSPYVRTATNNNALAYLSYNGDTNSSNWAVNEWIRLSATVTTQSNETAIYISNYIGTIVGDKIWYFGHQIEQKSHITNLVAGTRGTTVTSDGGWKDITNKGFDGELFGGITGDSNGVIFNGSDSFIKLNKSPLQMGIYDNSYTAECICYPTDLTGDKSMFGGGEYGSRHGMHLVFREGAIYLGHYGSDYGAGNVVVNNWYHIVFRFNKSTGDGSIFKNGVKQGTTQILSFIGDANMCIGGSYSDGVSPFMGKIALARIYNVALSDSEVLQNYNSTKSRFGY